MLVLKMFKDELFILLLLSISVSMSNYMKANVIYKHLTF